MRRVSQAKEEFVQFCLLRLHPEEEEERAIIFTETDSLDLLEFRARRRLYIFWMGI